MFIVVVTVALQGTFNSTVASSTSKKTMLPGLPFQTVFILLDFPENDIVAPDVFPVMVTVQGITSLKTAVSVAVLILKSTLSGAVNACVTAKLAETHCAGPSKPTKLSCL